MAQGKNGYFFGTLGDQEYNSDNRIAVIKGDASKSSDVIIIMENEIGGPNNIKNGEKKNEYIEKKENGLTIKYTYENEGKDLKITWDYKKPEVKKVAEKKEKVGDDTTQEKIDTNKFNKVEKHKFLGELRYRNTGGGRIEIEPSWVKNNIISYNIPVNLHKKFPKSINIHKNAYSKWDKAITLLAKSKDLINCIVTFDGVWVPRHIRWDDNKGLSNHSWGLAIDINASKYPMGTKVDEENKENIQVKLWESVFKPAGFSWGNSYKDPMHFEILKL